MSIKNKNIPSVLPSICDDDNDSILQKFVAAICSLGERASSLRVAIVECVAAGYESAELIEYAVDNTDYSESWIRQEVNAVFKLINGKGKRKAGAGRKAANAKEAQELAEHIVATYGDKSAAVALAARKLIVSGKVAAPAKVEAAAAPAAPAKPIKVIKPKAVKVAIVSVADVKADAVKVAAVPAK